MTPSRCLNLARLLGPQPFKDWLGGAYSRYDLTGGSVKIAKQNIWPKGLPELCGFLEQFPDVTTDFLQTYEGKIPERQPKKIVKKQRVAPKKKTKAAEEEEEEERVTKKKREEELRKKQKEEEEEKPEERKKTPPRKESRRIRFQIPVFGEERATAVGECLQIATLENFVNSCYMDSVLMLLMTVLEDFTVKYIIDKKEWTNPGFCDANPMRDTEIRNSIQQAFSTLHTLLAGIGEDIKCVNFRQALAGCKSPSFEPFALPVRGNPKKSTMRDAVEFLQFLFEIFDVNVMTEIITVLARRTGEAGFDVLRSEEIQTGQSPIWIVTASELKNRSSTSEMVSITAIQVPVEGGFGERTGGIWEFDASMEIRAIYDSPIIAMALQRRTYKDPTLTGERLYAESNETFDTSAIAPSEEITPISNRLLVLVGTIIYQSRHYTAVFRCENQWYHYNDIPGKGGKHLGLYAADYDSMIEASNRLVQTNGVVHFYVDRKMADSYNGASKQ